MVFMDSSHKNKIENSHDLKKYNWQKDHMPNQTGTEKTYKPNKNNNATKKKYFWKKIKLFI